MIYHKYVTDERTTIINELYEDELVTYCGGCEKEMPVKLKDIVHIRNEEADFVGTTFYCADCTKDDAS